MFVSKAMRVPFTVTFLTAVLMHSSAQAGSFSGRALGLDGQGIDGVRVRAIANGVVVATAFTDKTGTYQLNIPGNGPVSIDFFEITRVGTALNRLSAETEAGRMDVI